MFISCEKRGGNATITTLRFPLSWFAFMGLCRVVLELKQHMATKRNFNFTSKNGLWFPVGIQKGEWTSFEESMHGAKNDVGLDLLYYTTLLGTSQSKQCNKLHEGIKYTSAGKVIIYIKFKFSNEQCNLIILATPSTVVDLNPISNFGANHPPLCRHYTLV